MKATSTGPTLLKPLMTPTSPPLCFWSMRVNATAVGGAPALDIWLMKQSAKLGGGALSQALCTVVGNVAGICQTEVAVIRPIRGFCNGVSEAPAGAIGGFWAKPKAAVASRAASSKDSFMQSGSFAVPV